MQYHDAANIFPMMTEDEIEALGQDIEDNGQCEPIETFEGKILDGRNRFEACLMFEITPEFVPWTGDDPVAYVLSKNLHRRHLTESQRAMIGARYAKTKSSDESGLHAGKTESESGANLRRSVIAGEAVNVSPRSVNSATKVIDRGSKSLVQAVDNGSLPVSTAAKVADLPKSEQRKIATAENPKKAAREVLSAGDDADHMLSQARQYAAKLQRAIDDLNDLMPSNMYGQTAAKATTIVNNLGKWK